MFKIGIEQEFVFLKENGEYVDADNTDYSLFGEIVDAFPAFEGDDRFLDCKSIETYPKRCYVEGFERHDGNGKRIDTLPKALEVRTLPHDSVNGAVAEFRDSWSIVMSLAAERGLTPVLVSWNPYRTVLDWFSRLGEEEQRVRTPARFELAKRAMFTHGLHVNVSLEGFTRDQMQDRVDKVCHYTPSVIPWSYSSPFHHGGVFEGLCARNYFRASSRNMVDLNERMGEYVIEFRGFDACGDHRLLDAVLRLFTGFLLDETLPGRTRQQDSERLMLSSLAGFGDPSIREECGHILQAARAAQDGADEPFHLLAKMLENNDTYSARMKNRFADTGSIRVAISGHYDY